VTQIQNPPVRIPFTLDSPNARNPTQAYRGDVGWDLYVLEDTLVLLGTSRDVRTGISVAIPDGYYGRIVGRSSAFRKKNVLVLEGIIDAGFRGELFSHVYAPFRDVELEAGSSVAQLIIQRVEWVFWTLADELPESERGTRGFGSSGN
jgi:dUTP pyrophosphatase